MSHVTGANRWQSPFGTITSYVTLTDDGKPLPLTDEPEHVLNGFCWCQPLVETDAVTGDHLFIHRRSVDSPHIEADRATAREGSAASTGPERFDA